MTVIDSLEFAQTGQSLSGSSPISGLTRLQDSLADTRGEIGFTVKGGRDLRGRLILSVNVEGLLHLRCQRCLGTLDFPLHLENTLLLVESGAAEAPAFEADEAEWIEASATLDVTKMVEDEILLSLPFAPRHEEGSCRQEGEGTAGNARVSAFEKLAALKRSSN